jgi:hypothetical protein
VAAAAADMVLESLARARAMDDSRRLGAASRTVATQGPETALLGPPATRIEHPVRRFRRRRDVSGQQHRAWPRHHWGDLGAAHPHLAVPPSTQAERPDSPIQNDSVD